MSSFDFKKFHDDVLFVPLGGSNEVGMNLNLYTTQGKWLMVDCGIGFANDYLPGVEVVVPDVSFIAERKKDLLGLVVTHAHEDHIGAIPYLWREFECPIWATPFTAALIRAKLTEMGPGKKPEVHEIKPGGSLSLGPFGIQLLDLTHSIPEMQAVAITTPKGVIMHTGDWKFDEVPLIGPVSDYAGLKKFGDDKVLALVCDSTNVFVEGHSGSEGEVRKHLTEVIKSCQNRVVVTTFASNLARVATVIQAASDAGRHIALAGRSLSRVVEAARQSGYIKDDVEFLSDREVMNLPKSDVLLLCTGCQGEPRAALSRIARGDHPSIRLTPGDSVIFSSRKIPGNEMKINWVQNRLVEKKIEVISERDHFIHVSGHPARDELKRMYSLIRPQIAIPTHGEPRHLQEHARLAHELGVPETVQASNGSVVWLEPGEASVIGTVNAGYIAIDGLSMISTDGEVLRTRRKLRDDGAAFASVVIDRDGELATDPQISAPGLLDAKEDGDLLEECEAEITETIARLKGKAGDEAVREAVRLTLRKFFKRELDKKPVLEVLVSRI
ncbi:MAG: ribonuclease J [Proteobacteria bacterium]|nr:ribonuclease J [Pseudomonadota bacterium]